MALGACSNDNDSLATRTGKFHLNLQASTGLTQQSRNADDDGSKPYDIQDVLSALTVDDLTIKMVNGGGSFSRTWAGVAEMDNTEEFPVGTYTLSAFYGDPKEEGVDKPCLYGETDFTVKGAETVEVSVEAKLANSIVGVEFTDKFKQYFQAYSARIVSCNSNEFLFSAAEATPVYVENGTTQVLADVTLPSGQSGTVNLGDFEAAAATYHRVTLDVDATRGDLRLLLKFDGTLNEEVREMEISAQLFDAGVPVVTPEGFNTGEGTTNYYVEGNYAFNSYKFNIAARRGMKEVWLVKTSPRYGGGYQERYDLLNEYTRADLAAEHGITFIGVAKGEMFGKVDLTGWLKNLKRYDRNVAAEDVTFTLNVVDEAGATTDVDLAFNNNFKITILRETMEVEPAKQVDGDGFYEFKVHTNMNWLTGRLVLEQKEFDDVITPEYVVLPDSAVYADYSQNNVFTVRVAAPDDMFCFKHTTQSNVGTDGGTFTLYNSQLPEFRLSYDENDIFAKHGKVTVEPDDDEANLRLYDKLTQKYGAELTVTMTDDEGRTVELSDYQPAGKGRVYTFENLEYSTAKWARQEALQLSFVGEFKVVVDTDESVPVEFTTQTPALKFSTEAPLQLPDANFESWTSNALKSAIVHWTVGDGNVWGTLNTRTCVTTGINASYVGTSGTKQAAGRSGNGALIRTLGYGSGNTSSGNNSYVYNISQGELYLGTYDEGMQSANYGYGFKSRPSALVFWCKYEPKDQADHGQMQFRILDGSTKLFEKVMDLNVNDVNAYTTIENGYHRIEIPITYITNAKANGMELTFKSTIDEKAFEQTTKTVVFVPVTTVKNNSYWSLGNEHVGAELYIDDVELIYN